jgi:N-acetylglutamate synthase-like GNAT family acetyltransferase
MGLKQIDHGSAEYRQMVDLRNRILRQPLGLSFTDEELSQESDDILIAAYDEDEIVGCCMLVKQDNKTLRLRQMAVDESVQRKGVGASILQFAENLAHDKGFKCIRMHARDTALDFYKKLGYQVKGDVFIEVNLPHHIMEKELL